MAAGDLYIECEGGGKKLIAESGWLEKLNALAVKTINESPAKYGLRATRISRSAENIVPLIACGEPLKEIGDLLGWLITESTSGEPSIGLIEEA